MAVSWHVTDTLRKHLLLLRAGCIWSRISTLLTLSFLIFLVVNDHCWTEELHAGSHNCTWHITEGHQECAWCCQGTAQGPALSRVLWQAGCVERAMFIAVLELHRGLSFTVIHEMCCCHKAKPFASVLKGQRLKALYSWGISEFYPRKWKYMCSERVLWTEAFQKGVLQIPFLDGYKRCNKKDLRKQLFVRDLWMSSGIYQHHVLTSFLTKKKGKKPTFD